MCRIVLLFFVKHKTAYEMRISDWSSDVCSSDLLDDLQAAADPGKKIVEVVGNTPRQLSYGFHLLRLAKRLMRLRQFGGALEHTVFKCLVRFLSPTDEPRVFDRNIGLGGEANNDLLFPSCDTTSLQMPETEAAYSFPLPRHDRYGKIGCHQSK